MRRMFWLMYPFVRHSILRVLKNAINQNREWDKGLGLSPQGIVRRILVTTVNHRIQRVVPNVNVVKNLLYDLAVDVAEPFVRGQVQGSLTNESIQNLGCVLKANPWRILHDILNLLLNRIG